MRFETVDPSDDGALREWHAVRTAASDWCAPDEPRDPFAYVAAYVRHRPAEEPGRLLLARRADGSPAAAVELRWNDEYDNLHRVGVEPYVPHELPAADARELLGAIAAQVRGIGREVVCFGVVRGSASARLVDVTGAPLGLSDRRSVLRTAELDVPVLRGWTVPPDGYSLVAWDGQCPDDLLVPFAALREAMNTAPRGDLGLEDMVMPPERVRAYERVDELRRVTRPIVVARHDGSGELAGFTELLVSADRPETVEQGDTVVVPAHRGHGLGRVVKAANLLRLLAAYPAARFVETWNAESNEHMLAINVALGFRAASYGEERDLSLQDLEAAAGRPVPA